MSSYKMVDSTISVLYCARCAGEELDLIPPGSLVCRDCGNTVAFPSDKLKIGQIAGTKYKMRDTRRWSFRELIEEGRQDAFRDVYLPSPEPGKGKVGWSGELQGSDEGEGCPVSPQSRSE